MSPRANNNRCTICNKEFNNKSNCNRHVRNVHKVYANGEPPVEKVACVLCEKTFTKKCNLQRHIETIHFGQDENSKLFKCDNCNFQSRHQGSLKRHLKKTDHLKVRTKKFITCSICNAKYNLKKSFNRHLNKMHKIKTTNVTRTRKCPLCQFEPEEPSKNLMYAHFEQRHGIKIELEQHTFKTFADFMKWKKEIEISTTTSFVKMVGDKKNVKFYSCNRNGFYKNKGRNTRRLKTIGSCKIGGYCPASMRVTTKENGEINAAFCKSHVGHKNELKYKRRTEEERNSIATRLALKKPHCSLKIDKTEGLTGNDNTLLINKVCAQNEDQGSFKESLNKFICEINKVITENVTNEEELSVAKIHFSSLLPLLKAIKTTQSTMQEVDKSQQIKNCSTKQILVHNKHRIKETSADDFNKIVIDLLQNTAGVNSNCMIHNDNEEDK